MSSLTYPSATVPFLLATIETPFAGFRDTSKLVQKLGAKHAANYVWIAPFSLAANLAVGALSTICGLINLIVAPIFALITIFQGNSEERAKWVCATKVCLGAGATQTFTSFAFAIINSFAPTTIDRLAAYLEDP